MTELKIAIWSAAFGATIGSILSLLGTFVGSYVTERRERRHQVWQSEIGRIIELEERVGEIIELVGVRYRPSTPKFTEIWQKVAGLSSDAGRFRRHKGIMQAIRDLKNALDRLLEDRQRHQDDRETLAEVEQLFVRLVAEFDKVTGKRHI
jgi:hypothetical protein